MSEIRLIYAVTRPHRITGVLNVQQVIKNV